MCAFTNYKIAKILIKAYETTNKVSGNNKTARQALKITQNIRQENWKWKRKQFCPSFTITMFCADKRKFLWELCHLGSILFKLPILFSWKTNFRVLTFSFLEAKLAEEFWCFIICKISIKQNISITRNIFL